MAAAPHRNGAPVSTRLFASVRRAGGREPAGVASPALDAAPSPDRGSTELAERLREAWAGGEDVHALRRDAEAPGDVDGDHELGLGVDLHDPKVADWVVLKQPGNRRAGRKAGSVNRQEFPVATRACRLNVRSDRRQYGSVAQVRNLT